MTWGRPHSSFAIVTLGLVKALQRMQNAIRKFQPFRGHFALDGSIFLVSYGGHHFQAMFCVADVFPVLLFLWIRHCPSP